MKTTTVIPMILAVLMASTSCAAQHLPDDAAQALFADDVEWAVKTYRQANDEEPMAEGRNHFDVSPERSDQCAETSAVYKEPPCLPLASEEPRSNFTRNRVRTLNQTKFPQVVASASSTVQHPLDDAAQFLSAGDVEQAVETCRQVNDKEPTAESHNNLGVALERSGRFAEAATAYKKSLRLSPASEETRSNLNRSRIRAWIQAYLPQAACLFFGLLSIFVMIHSIKAIVRAWRRMRYRMKFRAVRLVSLNYRVQCHGGECQSDGNIYPDSESIALKADLLLPSRRDIYPLRLEIEIIQPDGSVWRTLQESVEPIDANRASICFQIDDLAGLLDRSGTWKARLVLRNIDKALGKTAFSVISRSDLIADLEVVDTNLIAVCGDQTGPDNIIFSDVEAVVPSAVIRPRRYHPTKFAGMRVSLELVYTDKPDEPERQTFPLELTDGQMEFCSVSRPIAGDPIAKKVGHWEFRLSVEDRVLARIPFIITTFEQALDSIKIESFDIAGTNGAGKVAQVGKVAYAQHVRALSPVITLRTRFPSRRISYEMTLGACIGDQPVGGVEGKLVFHGNTVQLIPGEFVPPHLDEVRDVVEVSFVLIVEGKTFGIREVLLRKRLPRCADAQGRIIHPPSSGEMDYDSEAMKILGQARVAG